jgi:hypothetical protein
MERNLGMPSGCEVESATLHVPVNEELVVAEPVRPGGLRGRLDALKSRGLEKVHDVRHKLGDRSVSMQSQLKSSMSNSPMKWAGIAAGSGFAIGMIGRLIHHRNKHRPVMDIVVIDAMC